MEMMRKKMRRGRRRTCLQRSSARVRHMLQSTRHSVRDGYDELPVCGVCARAVSPRARTRRKRAELVCAYAVNGVESVALSIGVVASVVVVHELGHFVAARVRGIRVTRFAIGFGPTLMSYSREKGLRLNSLLTRGMPTRRTTTTSASSSRAPNRPGTRPLPPSRRPSSPNSKSSRGADGDDDEGDGDGDGGGGDDDDIVYALNIVPLGGFVAFPEPSLASARRQQRDGSRNDVRGDDAVSDRSKSGKTMPAYADPNLLRNRPAMDQLLVAAAGVVVNMCVALAIAFTTARGVGVPVSESLPGVRVPVVIADGAASRCGLVKGDVISAINGVALDGGSRVDDAVRIIGESAGKEIALSVDRAADAGVNAVTVRVTPRATGKAGIGRIGVQLIENAELRVQMPKSVLDALRVSAAGVFEKTRIVADGIAQIFVKITASLVRFVTGAARGSTGVRSVDVKGPVGIVSDGAALFRRGDGPISDLESKLRLIDIANYAVYLNINLAVVNALPIPGLDGGYMLEILLVALREKVKSWTRKDTDGKSVPR